MTKEKSFKGDFEDVQEKYRGDAEKGKVQYRSQSALIEGLRCEVQTRNFKLTVDERQMLGGNDAGPNPVELILSALGACQEITYRLYADLLGIPMDGITVEVTGDINLCGFFDVDETARSGYSNIAADVVIDSQASEEDLQRLKEAVDDHCPVLDILSNAIPVQITVRKKDIDSSAAHAL